MKFILENCSKFLTSDFIQKTAKETNFKVRNKGINPVQFLETILNPNLDVASDTLNKISLEFSKSGIYVTRQSIFEKLNQSCVDFLELILESLILKTRNNSKVLNVAGVSDNISEILIADSSSVTLDSMHSEKYPGLSSKLKAMIKILLAVDPRSLSIHSAELSEGKKSDHKLNEHLFGFNKDTLVLKDLGFSSINDQEKIELHQGKYISRIKLDTDFYLPKKPEFTKTGKLIKGSRFEKIDISDFYKDLDQDEVVDTIYYFKNKENFYSRRVIITKVPKEKLQKREESIANKTRNPNHEISLKTRTMIPFNIYITNLKSEEVPAENIHAIYARRWDIELIFKKLKSTYNLDKVKVKVKIERILIQIYSKLIIFALECLYAQDFIKAFPKIEISLAKVGTFFKSYLEIVLKTSQTREISLSFLEKFLKKDIKKVDTTK